MVEVGLSFTRPFFPEGARGAMRSGSLEVWLHHVTDLRFWGEPEHSTRAAECCDLAELYCIVAEG